MNTEKKLNIAYDLQKNGSYREALEHFKNVSSDPAYAKRAKLEIAKTYKMMNLPAESINGFIELVNLDPQNNEAIKELGEIARLSSICDEAIKVLTDICGKNALANLELSKIYYQLGDFDNALEKLKVYSQKVKGDPEINVVYGKIYKKLGKLEEAAVYLEKVLVKDKENYEALYETGDLCFNNGDYKNAKEFLLKASRLKDDKEAHLKLLEIYSISGDRDNLEKEQKKILELTPKNLFDQDLALNRIEIIKKDVVLKSKVKRLWATLTTRCNIRCKTCGLWNKKWDLPYKTAKEIMDYYPYIERVVWLGGEVFLYEHFEEMFDKAAGFKNLTQHVITNGVILSEKWIDKITKTSNTELAVSVDGITKEVYESIRQGSNFEKLIKNIKTLMKYKKQNNSNMNIRLNAVIMKTNYRQLEGFLEFARNEGFNQVSLMALHFDLTPEEDIFYGAGNKEASSYVSKTIPVLKEKAKEYKIDLDILLPSCGNDFTEIKKKETCGVKENNAKKIEGLNCTMPWQYMMICDDGNVLLTGSCLKSIGNINENSLDDIWNSPMAVGYRQNIIDKKFKDICRTECMSRWDK